MTAIQAEQIRSITAEISAADHEIVQLQADVTTALPALLQLHTQFAETPQRLPTRDEMLLLLLPVLRVRTASRKTAASQDTTPAHTRLQLPRQSLKLAELFSILVGVG